VRALSARIGRASTTATVDAGLLDRALRTFDLDDADRERAKQSAKDVFLIEYTKGGAPPW